MTALFQSAQHVCNMFSYKRVSGTDNARPKDSKKNGNFQKNKNKKKPKTNKQKNDFYPKMKFFQNTGKILCLMKKLLSHTVMQI